MTGKKDKGKTTPTRSLADLLVEIRHFGSGIRSVVDTEVVELSAPETRGGGG